MKKIRVLFVINSMAGGGAERVLSYILKFINKEQFEISLITFKDEIVYEINNDIEYYSLDKKGTFDLFRVIYKLSRVLKSKNYNLVVSFLTYTNIFVAISWLLSGSKIPLILSERSNPKINIKNQKYATVKKFFVKIFYPKADVIVVPSQGVKKEILKSFKVTELKIKQIYNPLDLAEIGKLSQEKISHSWFKKFPVIITCGRLTRAKNFNLLIRTFKKLKSDNKEVKLAIIGDGEEKKSLEDLVNKLNLKNEVTFLGFQKNPYKYISRATIFVLSSKWEGFPNVLLEAMACGVPVVSTDCPYGPNEIIENGKNGILVPVNDEDSLVEAMEKLLKNFQLRETFSNEGRRFAENKFKLEKIIKDWEKLFLEVIDGRF